MNRTASSVFLAEPSDTASPVRAPRVRLFWGGSFATLGLLLAASALTVLLVFFLGALQMSGFSDAPTLSLRSMNTSPSGGAAPPPPPPPSSAESAETPPPLQLDLPTLNLDLANTDAPAIKAQISNKLDFQLQPLHFAASTAEYGSGDGTGSSGQPGLARGSMTFGLADLDSQPKLVNRPTVSFPASQLRRGVKEAKVVLEVLVKSNGAIHIKRVLESPHEDFTAMARSFATRARFTPPKKDGRPVDATYKWPLTFTAHKS